MNESNIRSLSLLQLFISVPCMITAIFIKMKHPYFQILTYWVPAVFLNYSTFQINLSLHCQILWPLLQVTQQVFSQCSFFFLSKVRLLAFTLSKHNIMAHNLVKKKITQKCPDLEHLKDKTSPIFIISKNSPNSWHSRLDWWFVKAFRLAILYYVFLRFLSDHYIHQLLGLWSFSMTFTQHFQVYNSN